MKDYLISAGKWVVIILAILIGYFGGGAISLFSIAWFFTQPGILPFLSFLTGVVIVGLAIPGVGRLFDWINN